MATATAHGKQKQKAMDKPTGEPHAPDEAIPAGATYLCGLHDKTKSLCQHMDDKGPIQEHEEVKGFHSRMRKSLDEHLSDLKGTFKKAYPDIEGLEDDEEATPEDEAADDDPEATESEETAKKAPMPGKSQLRFKGKGRNRSVPMTGVVAVKAASDLLANLANEGNLTVSQKTALLHTAGQLSAACAVPTEEPADPAEIAHFKALVEAAEVRLNKKQTLVQQALGLK